MILRVFERAKYGELFSKFIFVRSLSLKAMFHSQ